jgi:hypothetical protein
MFFIQKLAAFFILLIFLFSSSTFGGYFKRDDFKKKKDTWVWITDGQGSRFDIANGCCLFELKNTNTGYCNTELVNKAGEYQKYGTIVVRLKTSQMQWGTRGWGWWDRNKSEVLTDFDVNWVMQSKNKDNLPFTNWFKWGNCNGALTNLKTFGLPAAFDPTAWHTYKMEWDAAGTKLYVDDALYQSSAESVPNDSMSLDIWIDNGDYSSADVATRANPAGVAWQETSQIIVDFVDMFDLAPSENHAPEGNVVLWDRPNSFASGKSNYLWRTNTFNSTGEKVLFFCTAKVESSSVYKDDDDLKFVIDDADFGWDNNFAFCGNKENGMTKSIAFTHVLKAGAHNLNIYSDISPLLYDVVIIDMANSALALDTAIQATAPGTGSIEWKNFSFDAGSSGEAVIIVSGSAEKGDSINIILDEQTIGTISGNELCGDAKTLVMRKELSSGNHGLKITAAGMPVLHRITVTAPQSPHILIPGANSSSSGDEDIFFNPWGRTNLIIFPNPDRDATLQIHDVSGRLIETFNHLQSNSMIWNSKTIPGGIYFLNIKTNNKDYKKPLLLQK